MPAFARTCLPLPALTCLLAPLMLHAEGVSRSGCKPAGAGCAAQWVCCPKWEKAAVQRSGFDVTCEPICVPRIRLPWQDECAPRCAYVRTVHRLKPVSVDCGEKCVLTWEPRAVCPRCGKPALFADPGVSCAPARCAAP